MVRVASEIFSLARDGRLLRRHDKFAHIALDEVADVPDPRILELGSGHAALSTSR